MTDDDPAPSEGPPIRRRNFLKVGAAGAATGSGWFDDAVTRIEDLLTGRMGEAAPTSSSHGDGALAGDGAPRTMVAELTAPGGDRFGVAVALDGATAAVGAPPGMDMEPGEPEPGTVPVFARKEGSWTRQSTLTPGDDTTGGQFGAAVAVDGATVLVGAPMSAAPNGPHRGTATVFTRSDGDWHRESRLAAADPTGVDRFGTAVALDGDTAVVGAPGAATASGSGTGSASVFTRAGGTWDRAATLVPDDGVDGFGRAVAVEGDVAVVGARRTRGSDPTDAGVAVVFERAAGTWTKRAELAPGGTDRDDRFGTALATDGETVLAGAPAETNAVGVDAGVVYAFDRSGGAWHRDASLREPNGGANHRFGAAVALDGDAALVGTAFGGGTFVVTRSGGQWIPRTVLDSDDRPGMEPEVALSGPSALVGVNGSAVPPDGPDGSVAVFEP